MMRTYTLVVAVALGLVGCLDAADAKRLSKQQLQPDPSMKWH